MAYDAARDRIVLFGGLNLNPPHFAQTWTWDGAAWRDATPMGPNPAPRRGHAMAYDADRQVVVLFGGIDDAGAIRDDTWEWDGAAWHQVGASGPPARRQHVLLWDPGSNRVLLTGGYGPTAVFADVWEFDGLAWTERPTQGQRPAASGLFGGFDTARGRAVLTGGLGTLPSDETWELDGDTWLHVADGGLTPARYDSAGAFDPVRGQIVIFGGRDTGNAEAGFADTWVWSGPRPTTPLTLTRVPASRVVFAGNATQFEAQAVGSGPVSYRWRRNGVDLNDGGSISGATTPTLRIEPVLTEHAGNIDLVAVGACGPTTSPPALLGVTCDADCDLSTGPGVLDIFDFLCFQNRFAALDPYACDCDTTSGPLVCDIFDFLCFQNAFAAGCP